MLVRFDFRGAERFCRAVTVSLHTIERYSPSVLRHAATTAGGVGGGGGGGEGAASGAIGRAE